MSSLIMGHYKIKPPCQKHKGGKTYVHMSYYIKDNAMLGCWFACVKSEADAC